MASPLERVCQFLVQATDPAATEEEARTFAMKAAKLIKEHKLTMLTPEALQDYVSLVTARNEGRLFMVDVPIVIERPPPPPPRPAKPKPVKQKKPMVQGDGWSGDLIGEAVEKGAKSAVKFVIRDFFRGGR